MDGMASPSAVRVRVDKQGRLVLPLRFREDLVEVPGEVILEPTVDGLLLKPVHGPSRVRTAEDGLPVLDVGRPVTNDEVLAAVARERQER